MLPQGSKFSLVLWFVLQTTVVNIKAQSIITTVAGNGTQGYSGDGGQATSAELHGPTGVIIDSLNNIYIAEQYNHIIRKVNSAGIISTIAGTGVSGFSGDNGPAILAQLNLPTNIVLNKRGELFIADQQNSRVRKIDTNGIITTIAGNGNLMFSGDGGPAISAGVRPAYVALDMFDNLYISDSYNLRIRKINSFGIITTIVGNGISGSSGDGGQATQAEIMGPSQIMFDSLNNLYFADENDHRVRKVDTNGIITTIAGCGIPGNSGDNGPAASAKLMGPTGIAIDKHGNLFIADFMNNNVRKVNVNGIITTIAGTNVAGFNGDGIPASTGELNAPVTLFFDRQDNLYIADDGNNRIRLINNLTVINHVYQSLLCFPNPVSSYFFIETNTTEKLNVYLYDANGRQVFSANISDKSTINVTPFDEGVYTLIIKTVDRIINKKLVIIR